MRTRGLVCFEGKQKLVSTSVSYKHVRISWICHLWKSNNLQCAFGTYVYDTWKFWSARPISFSWMNAEDILSWWKALSQHCTYYYSISIHLSFLRTKRLSNMLLLTRDVELEGIYMKREGKNRTLFSSGKKRWHSISLLFSLSPFLLQSLYPVPSSGLKNLRDKRRRPMHAVQSIV